MIRGGWGIAVSVEPVTKEAVADGRSDDELFGDLSMVNDISKELEFTVRYLEEYPGLTNDKVETTDQLQSSLTKIQAFVEKRVPKCHRN